jgi:uncharacterized protein YpuA (DUF1002 family)
MNICHAFKTSLLGAALVTLAACGVETAGTAATAGAVKKNEIQQGRVVQEQVQQQLQKSAEQTQQRNNDPLANGY